MYEFVNEEIQTSLMIYVLFVFIYKMIYSITISLNILFSIIIHPSVPVWIFAKSSRNNMPGRMSHLP